MITTEQRYELYVKYCNSIRVKPSSFLQWQKLNSRIPDGSHLARGYKQNWSGATYNEESDYAATKTDLQS